MAGEQFDLETLLSTWSISTGSDMTVQGAYDWIVSDLAIKLEQGWPIWLVDGLIQRLDELVEATEPDTAFQLYNDWRTTALILYDIMWEYEELDFEEVNEELKPSPEKYFEALNAKVDAAASSQEAHQQGEITYLVGEALEQTAEDLTNPTAWPWWLQAAALGVGFILIRDWVKP